MKHLLFPLVLAGGCLSVHAGITQGGGTVTFGNNSSSLMINGQTGLAVTAGDGIQAALYWAPLGSNTFSQIGPATNVGTPLPGLFAGGTRTTGPFTPGGAVAQFQVRAWSGGFAAYEQAVASGNALTGQSAILQGRTGNPAGAPPTPPGSLIAYGLPSLTLNLPGGCSNSSPGIFVTKQCPASPVGPGGALIFTGTVTNTGNVTLTNVTVVNDQPASNTLVFGPATLAPAAGANFTGSYTVSASCASHTDTLTARGASICGGSVTNSVSATCPGNGSPAILVAHDCQHAIGSVTNTGNITLTNVTVVDDQPAPNTLVFGPATLAPGSGTNFTSFGVSFCASPVHTLAAQGTSICGVTVTNILLAACSGLDSPAMVVRKICPPSPVVPGGVLVFTGTVTNTGNSTLTNLLIVNNQPSNNTPVLGPITLAPGAGTNFTGSYAVPVFTCGPYSDTLTATARSICGLPLTNAVSASCPGTNSPAIAVTKQCPPVPVAPGGTLVFTGTVTNTGNTTLTNVIVVNNQPVPNTHVFGPVALAPGAGTNFTGSYMVSSACGPFGDTLTASGNTACGVGVTNSVSATCPGTNSPAIVVTKRCPAPVAPGGTLVFTGTVTNTGNITLTNVTVVDNQPSNNTPILGPITLLAGTHTNFTGSYTVPSTCGPFTDTLTAIGTSICGKSVTNSVAASCPGGGSPAITVTKLCPFAPVAPGGTLVFTGTVTNIGNTTLTNVTVVNNHPSNNTPVIGPITLAPGAGTNFTSSYTVAACGPYTDTLTAKGTSTCGISVTNNASATCPSTVLPAILVTKRCPPSPVAPGGTLVFTGGLTNIGNTTLTNVLVVNDQPTNNTPVFGPVTLAAGAGTNFSGSYTVPSTCGPYTDTLIAKGTTACGIVVTNAASAVCSGTASAMIAVTKQCPAQPVGPGGALVFTGTVTNTGNTALTNVVVVNNQPAPNTLVFGPVALAPGAGTNFSGGYTVSGCGPYADTLTAMASSVCGGSVTNSASANCPAANSAAIAVTKNCPAYPVPPGGTLTFTGTVTNTGNIALTNVVVMNDKPASNTMVFGPVTLAPGAGASFSGSYTVTACSCGPFTDTLTAKGTSLCGFNVTNSMSATCPGNTNPVPGDLNGDGIVDQNELNIVLSNYWAHSPWLYMTNAALLCGGRFQFALTNASGWNFTVLVSSNLVDWTNLPDPAYPVYQFFDPAAGSNAAHRFYRLSYP